MATHKRFLENPKKYGCLLKPLYIGSWQRAIESAGLDYSLIKKMPGPKKKNGIIVSKGEYISA